LNTVRKIAKNSVVIFAAQGISYLLSFLYMMYLARDLGPANFGVLSFAIAYSNMFSVFFDWGLQTFVTREISRNKELAIKYLANISVIKIILSTVTFGIMALILNLSGYPSETITVVYILAISLIFTVFCNLFYSIYQAFQVMEYSGIGQILYSALIFGGVIVSINYHLNVEGYALIFMGASIAVLLYNLIIAKRIIGNTGHILRNSLEVDWSFWKTALIETTPFGLHILFCNIFTWVDVVILASLQGNEAAGIYSAGARIYSALLFLPNAFTAAIFPLMSHYHISGGDSLKLSLEKSSKYIFIIGLPMSAGIIILAPRIINLIYGQQYMLATITLKILACSLVFTFLDIGLSIYLSAINRQTSNAKISFVGAILGIGLNALLIPQYSYVASSFIRAAIDFIMFILLVCVIVTSAYKVNKFHTVNLIIKVLVATILMGVLAYYLSNFNLAAVIMISAMFYFILIFIFRVFDKTDMKMVQQLIGK